MDAKRRKLLTHNRRLAQKNKRLAGENQNRRLAGENRRLPARVRQAEGELRSLTGEISSLQARVRGLQEEVQVLTEALHEARRAGKRQAAPFGKPKRTQEPRKAGRKSGKDYGRHARRTAPQEAPIGEEHQASLPPEYPQCGLRRVLEDQAPSEQYQAEIICRTVRRRFTIVLPRVRCLPADCGWPPAGRARG